MSGPVKPTTEAEALAEFLRRLWELSVLWRGDLETDDGKARTGCSNALCGIIAAYKATLEGLRG